MSNTDTHDDPATEAFAELINSLQVIFLMAPHGRAVMYVSALLLEISPYIFEVFRKLVHSRPLELKDVARPTMQEMLYYFGKQLTTKKCAGYLPADPRKRYLKLRAMYYEFLSATSAEQLASYRDCFSAKFIADRVAQNNERREYLYMQMLPQKLTELGVLLPKETARDIMIQIQKVISHDISSERERNRIVANLTPRVQV